MNSSVIEPKYGQGADYWPMGAGWRHLQTRLLGRLNAGVICEAAQQGLRVFSFSVALELAHLQGRLALIAKKNDSGIAKIQLSLLGRCASPGGPLVADFSEVEQAKYGNEEVSPERHFLKTYTQCLESVRRKLLPDSLHRRKACGRIKFITGECQLERISAKLDISWLDVTNIAKLLGYIDIHYPTNENLPEARRDLEAYINEFSSAALALMLIQSLCLLTTLRV